MKILGSAISFDTKKVTNSDLGNPIWYNSDYRKVESELCNMLMDDSDEEIEDDNCKEECDDEGSEEEQLTQNDKYLIFTTGFKTYTPHQIGIVTWIAYIFFIILALESYK